MIKELSPETKTLDEDLDNSQSSAEVLISQLSVCDVLSSSKNQKLLPHDWKRPDHDCTCWPSLSSGILSSPWCGKLDSTAGLMVSPSPTAAKAGFLLQISFARNNSHDKRRYLNA
ncbi:hypothetical protein OJAV_G00202140 [Oryzias javanicus]|uniref:Uncharacterized protein n=1 Tax=Oryzias javanicus TaxID=123683 RepID=A0A437C4W7_ORYJA|nr:hypothetical protein OJAV_G00202140 [Oryzias javanicus]